MVSTAVTKSAERTIAASAAGRARNAAIAKRSSSGAPRSTAAAPRSIPQSMTGTITLAAAAPTPGTSSSASSLARVMAPRAHQENGATLNKRIAASNHRNACVKGTARGVAVATGSGSASIALSMQLLGGFAQIGGAHLRIGEQPLGFAVERDLAAFHHIAATAHFQCELGVLLDQQDGHALLRDREHRFKDFLHHQRRESH